VDGKPFATSAPLSRLLKRLLKLAGIDQQFPAYSIRHSLITALFDGGLSEIEVNAYTGHSNNAHTAVTSYNHMNHRWVGHALASGQFSDRAKCSALPVIEKDNAVYQAEDMSEYGEVEAPPSPTSSSSASVSPSSTLLSLLSGDASQ
jgi:hypothetical protein